MIYGVAAQPSNGQQRWSLRSLLYTKVIPRSQRTAAAAAANGSRDNDTHAQTPAPRQDSQRPVFKYYFRYHT